MATTYVGFYRPAPEAADVTGESPRKAGGQVPEFQPKTLGLPANLPASCRLIASWGASGGGNPGVMVVEAESFDDLQHISQYYNGRLQFDWHPTLTGGVPRI